MLQLTNSTDTLKFVAFIQEAMNYVSYLTPTKINSGGCGIFARALHKLLSDNNIESEIIALYFDEKSDKAEKNLIDYVNNNNKKVLSEAGADHIVLKVNEIYVDSTGLVNMAALMSRNTVKLTLDQLNDIIDKGEWNEVFDREQEPFIIEKLQEVFNNYENYHFGLYINKQLAERKIRLSDHTIKTAKRLQREAMSSMFGFSGNINNNNNSPF